MTSFSPSSFQSAFFKEVSEGTSSILLNAPAGSGKTTTGVHATTLVNPHVLTIFLAFGKKTAEELEKKVPRYVQTGTFHSRCAAALRRSLPKSPKVNKDKVRDILKSAQKSKFLSWEEYQTYSQSVVKLVSLAKSAGIGTELASSGQNEWENLVSHFALTLDGSGDMSRAIELAQRTLEESNQDLSQIDFDDMLYLALLRKVSFDKATNIFVDEAQDTNSIQRALLKRMGNFRTFEDGPINDLTKSRLFAVGDPNQSIYGFRGADASAMELLQSEFSMKPMDLSICYRCSKSVIREVHKKLNL